MSAFPALLDDFHNAILTGDAALAVASMTLALIAARGLDPAAPPVRLPGKRVFVVAGAFGVVTAALLSMASLPSAHAQAADEQAAARVLFNEARALLKAERYDAACPKLEAAAHIYRGSGVLLNLADCYEHLGRAASAWSEFGEAASLAAQTGRPEDETEARRRQALIERDLAHLVVQVEQPAPSLVLTWDGKELLAAAWQTPIPVDPGPHRLQANAPGRAGWEKTILVPSRATESVDVPVLAPAPVPDTPPALLLPPPSRQAHYWTVRRKAGVAVGAVGVAGLVGAGFIALAAKSEFTRSNGETGSARVNDSGSAVTLGNVATVVVGLGVAATAVGAVVWLTAPSASVQIALQPSGIEGTF